MYSQPDASKKKRDQFANKIRSEQRKRHFSQQRQKLQQARQREDDQQAAQAEYQLQQMFKHQNQYQAMMAMADKLQQEQREYEQYIARLEQESINYEIMQKRQLIEEIKKQMEEQLAHE